jgi:hypothetical protein
MVKFLTIKKHWESRAGLIPFAPANDAADTAINRPLTQIPNIVSISIK